jgi:hypothetical protein
MIANKVCGVYLASPQKSLLNISRRMRKIKAEYATKVETLATEEGVG